MIPAGGESEGGGESPAWCEVERIQPGRFQPRKRFREESLQELADSIKAQGVLAPLVVRPRAGGGFELIAGERRLRAAKLAGLSKVPVVVREADDRQALELSLVENLQREDLDPLEEAEAYRQLMTEFEYTQEELGRRVGKDRATLSNALRLLKLPEDLQDDLRAGLITAGHARAILMAGSEALMRRIRDAVVDDEISVREAERLAQGKGKKKVGRSSKKGVKSAGADVHVREIEESLVRALQTRVKVIGSAEGGRIEITFFSREDLDRIYRRILGS